MGPPSDLPSPTSLLGVSRALIEDPEAKAAFDEDPDRWLADRGFGDLDPAEAAVGLDHVADALPPALAAALTEGRHDATGPGTPFAAAAAIDPDTAEARWAERVADDGFGLEAGRAGADDAEDPGAAPAPGGDADPTDLDLDSDIDREGTDDPAALDGASSDGNTKSETGTYPTDVHISGSGEPSTEFGQGAPGTAWSDASPTHPDAGEPAMGSQPPVWAEATDPMVELGDAPEPEADLDPATLDEAPASGNDRDQSEAFDPGI